MNDFPPDVVEALKKRYSKIPPLVFHRSCERVQTVGELFDVLDDYPYECPIVWSEESKRWVTTKDLFQTENFDLFKETENERD